MMDWKTLLNSERPRPSSGTNEARTQFERDFDRAIFSTPVKRLQDKAQVFPLEPHDSVRTRLTHSLEVSSVARGLARNITPWLENISPEMERSIEAIAATCGLIHDLGNPPFGHAGEDAIRDWFKDKFGEDINGLLDNNEQCINDFLKFEGNAQSLRLVAKLQILSDSNGLNLTYGTLSASCKYIAASHQSNDGHKNHAFVKPGFFASEQKLIEDIRAKTGTGEARNPITFLVEAADDIVYSVADVEDGIKKGILRWSELEKLLGDADDPQIRKALEKTIEILEAGTKSVPKNLPDDAYGTAFRTAAIALLVPSVSETFKDKYNQIMSGTYYGELVEDCDAYTLIRKLKEIGKSRIYCTTSTLKLELMGRKVISDLMEIFWMGAKELPLDGRPKTKSFSGKAGALLSENYRSVFQHSVKTYTDLSLNYHRFQLVTDYVCGMTDTFAKTLHSELTNGT